MTADSSMQRGPLRWAIVGTGTISGSVVPDLASCADVAVVTVQSRDATKAARFAQEFAIPASTGDYAAVLGDDTIDAVYLATPFATHHDMARRALLAGKHVLVEKPMAMNAAEVADLFAIAKQEQRFVMEAMWMKFNPAFRRLQKEIAGGRIGEVRSMRAAFSMPMPQGGGSRWDLARSGGALLDQGIYPVTLAHAFLGTPESVHAAGTTRQDGLDLAQHFTLEFGGGSFAQGASGMTEFSDLSASVHGTKGWIVLPTPFWSTTSLEIHADDLRTVMSDPARVDLPREGNGYVPMLREVTEAIRAGLLEHPVHPASDTISTFQTLDEIRVQVTPGR